MSGNSRRSAFGLLLAVLIVAFCFSPQFRDIYQLPPHMRIIEGETARLNVAFPWTMTVNQDQAVKINSRAPAFPVRYRWNRSAWARLPSNSGYWA